MIISERQVKLFGVKKVAEREWYRQNRLREPFIKNFNKVMTNYYRNLANEINNTWQTRSTFLIDLDLNRNQKVLQS